MRAAVWLLAMASAAHADVCAVDELPARVEKLTGRTVDPSTFSAKIDGHRVTVVIGDGSREIEGATCDAALDAAALVIGMAAPDGVAQLGDREQPTPGAPRAVEIASTPSIAPPPLIPPPTIASEGLSVAGGVGVTASGIEATSLGASWRRGAHSFAAEATVTAANEVVVTPSAGAAIRELTATGVVCGHVSVLAACALVTGGVSYGTSDHLKNAHDGALPLLAIGARLVWEYPQDGRIAIRVLAQGAVRETQTHFDIDDMPVWTSRRFDGLASGAVVVRFP